MAINSDDVAYLDEVTVVGRNERPDRGEIELHKNDKDDYLVRPTKPKSAPKPVPKTQPALEVKQPIEPPERIDKVYTGFPTGKGFYLVLHEYKENIIGHANIEFVHDAKRDGWFGANIEQIEFGNITGGIKEEYNRSQERIRKDNRDHAYKIIEISEKEYYNALTYSQNLANKYKNNQGDYDLIGKAHNCVDFVMDTLKKANIKNSEKLVADFMKGNTLANGYAEVKALKATGMQEKAAYKKVFSDNSEFKQFKDIPHNDIPRFIAEYSRSSRFNAVIMSGGSENNTYDIDMSKRRNIIISDEGGQDTLNIQNFEGTYSVRRFGEDLAIIDKKYKKCIAIKGWFREKEVITETRWRGGFRRYYETRIIGEKDVTNQHKIEKIVLNGKHSLSYEKIDKLIQSMARFHNPTDVSTSESTLTIMPNPTTISINSSGLSHIWKEIK